MTWTAFAILAMIFFFSSFIQNPSGARVMQRRNVTLEHGFLEAEHKLGKVGIVQRIVSYLYLVLHRCMKAKQSFYGFVYNQKLQF